MQIRASFALILALCVAACGSDPVKGPAGSASGKGPAKPAGSGAPTATADGGVAADAVDRPALRQRNTHFLARNHERSRARVPQERIAELSDAFAAIARDCGVP